MAPELGAVGFGASIGGYSAVENLTYNAAKGKTTASDSIEAIAGGLGEGLFAGIMHKASSKVASKASESTPAKPEPIRPMTEAELEKVSGGAKDPGWRPGTGNTANSVLSSDNFDKIKNLIKCGEVSANGRRVIYELDERTRVIFGLDLDANAHPLRNQGYMKPVDHMNIEIQTIADSGKVYTKWDMHLILDKDRNVIDRVITGPWKDR